MEQNEKYTISLINNLDVVFDVGARTDGFEFVKMFPNCEFHFFEPHLEFYEILKSNMPNKANVRINQYGLWEKNMNSAVYYQNVQSFTQHPFIQSEDEGTKYDLRTIDWYVKENNIKKIDFLKIDAEGCDYKILLGAKNTISLNNIRYIQFEYWNGVKKFKELLESNFDMYFITEDSVLKYLDDSVVSEIDDSRIPSRLGGDIFCAHKKENFIA